MRRLVAVALAAGVFAACSGNGGRSLDVVKDLEDAPVETASAPPPDVSGTTDAVVGAQGQASGGTRAGSTTVGTSDATSPTTPGSKAAASAPSTLARGVRADKVILGWEG